MANFKSKAKKFWEENKGSVIGSTVAVAVAVAGVCLIANKSYRAGLVDGGAVGWNLAVDWLDKTFPEESNARELYETWAKANPDQMVSRKGPGKWS